GQIGRGRSDGTPRGRFLPQQSGLGLWPRPPLHQQRISPKLRASAQRAGALSLRQDLRSRTHALFCGASMIERIAFEGIEFAIILRSTFREPGVRFFTPEDYSQQLGHMRHPKGHVIEAHVHNPVSRAVQYTEEALFLRRGRLRVDFYSDEGSYLESRDLG